MCVQYWHPSLLKEGLQPTREAPLAFVAWVEALLREWDFDNICTAHIGNKVGWAGRHRAHPGTEGVPGEEHRSIRSPETLGGVDLCGLSLTVRACVVV
jgi:hypothetical protein